MRRKSRSLWHKAMGALVIVLLLLMIGATVSEAAPPACKPRYHKVKWGETLYSIGRLYGVSPWTIAQANGIWNPDHIYASQVLLIPCGPQWPPCPWPKPWPWRPCPWKPWPGRVHIVQYGETLAGIAWRYGTTVWAIAQANGIWNPDLIHVGQRLVIN